MDIRNSLEGLKSLLGTSQAAPPHAADQEQRFNQRGCLGSDRATFSSAGSEVAQAAADSGVRMDKVASIQAALAAGTYSAPASAVASKLVTSMRAANNSPGHSPVASPVDQGYAGSSPSWPNETGG